MFNLILGVVSWFVIGSQSASAPFITPCKIGDDACLIKSAQAAIPHFAAGIPDLGVPTVDPLNVNDINSDSGNLKLRFKDMKITGLAQCKFISASLPDKSNLELVIECPIQAVGKYTLNGKISVVPIEGNGNFEIKTEKVQFDLKAQIKEANGRWVVEDFDYTFDPVERFYFTFENLFNGNQERAKPVITILNESWKEVILELGKPVINEIVTQVKNDIVKFFDAVPSTELYLA